MPADRLHVSLNSLGGHAEPPLELIARAKAAAVSVSMPPFVVALDRVAPWGRGSGERPVVAWADDGLIGARLLHARIHDALAAAGLAPDAEPAVEPHLTLLRAAAPAPLVFVEPISWRVDAFVLLNSRRGANRLEQLGRWPLLT
jgi:2'-5' RNA ligase